MQSELEAARIDATAAWQAADESRQEKDETKSRLLGVVLAQQVWRWLAH